MAWTKEELKHQGNKEINIVCHRMSAVSFIEQWVYISMEQLLMSRLSSAFFWAAILNLRQLLDNLSAYLIFLNFCSLDKALHSAGFDSGFIILGTNLTNPLNMLLPVLQTVSKLIGSVQIYKDVPLIIKAAKRQTVLLNN